MYVYKTPYNGNCYGMLQLLWHTQLTCMIYTTSSGYGMLYVFRRGPLLVPSSASQDPCTLLATIGIYYGLLGATGAAQAGQPATRPKPGAAQAGQPATADYFVYILYICCMFFCIFCMYIKNHKMAIVMACFNVMAYPTYLYMLIKNAEKVLKQQCNTIYPWLDLPSKS